MAGVNIASVYRYFPNKDAILAEIYERQLQLEGATLDALHARAAEIDALPLDGTLRLLVDVYAEHRLRLLRLHEDFYRRHHDAFDLAERASDRYAHSWQKQSAVWLGGVLAPPRRRALRSRPAARRVHRPVGAPRDRGRGRQAAPGGPGRGPLPRGRRAPPRALPPGTDLSLVRRRQGASLRPRPRTARRPARRPCTRDESPGPCGCRFCGSTSPDRSPSGAASRAARARRSR